MSTPERRWWQEPLLHFLLLGGALFGVDLALNPPGPDAGEPQPIAVSPELAEALARGWDEAKGRPLTDDERQAVLVRHVRDEALVREARRLGLDRGDPIVRRRLVQKMEFLADAGVEVADPDDTELAAWFADHADDYVRPARTSFLHRFYSRSRRGDGAHADAVAALAQLEGAGADAPVRADPFVGPRSLSSATRSRINRDFGGDFATAVIELDAGRWHGPIASSYGFHLVFVTARQAEAAAEFAERRAEALDDWRGEARVAARDAAIDAIVARHTATAE